MRVWLVKEGEPLPTDEGNPRLLRSGILAEMLAERGHDVTLWTSTFDFRTKRHRFPADTELKPRPNLTIRLLRAPSFRKHLSIRRLVYYSVLSGKFARHASRAPKPDVILCAYPTIDLALASVRYGREHHVPVTVDVLDLWPDIFLHRLPRRLVRLGKPYLNLMFRQAHEVFESATSITGITSPIVEWGVAKSGRARTSLDREFAHAYPGDVPSEAVIQHGLRFWSEQGVVPGADWLTVCYLGQLTATVEFDTVADAFTILERDALPIRLVLAGAGDREGAFRERASGLRNVHFGGWVGSPEAWALLSLSQIGLLCYHATFDYEMSIPNKPIEYMAAGLPILSSLTRGVLSDLLHNERIGATYRNGDPQALADHLRSQLDRRDELAAAGARAREVFESRFRADVVYDQMCDHLEAVARHGSPRVA